MTEQPIKVAIVGCGAIAPTHARAVTGLGAHVSALIDPDPASAERLAEELTAASAPRPSVFSDLAAALADEAVDVVAVTNPTGAHVATAAEALRAGKHVLVEKPLDVTLPAALALDRTAAAAAENGVVASAVLQHRFDPSSALVHQAIREGRLGRLTSAVASVPWWRSQAYYDSADWRGTWAMDGGGAVLNQGIHTLDLLVWFLGAPSEITAHIGRLAHTAIEVEDTAVAMIRFESGALAVLHASTAAHPGLLTRIEVMGDRGSAVIEQDRLAYFYEAARDHAAVGPLGLTGGRNQADEVLDPDENVLLPDPTDSAIGHARQYADLLTAIRTHRQPLVSVHDAIPSLATAHAIYAAGTLEHPVTFVDVLDGAYSDLAYRVTETALRGPSPDRARNLGTTTARARRHPHTS